MSSTSDDEPPCKRDKKAGRSTIWQHYTKLSSSTARCNSCEREKQPVSQKRESALNQKVAEMVALDLQPYSFVEDLKLYRATICHPRTTLSRVLIPRLYDDTRAKVRAELRKAFEDGTTTLAFTSDIWTSRANESFISLTCHFLTVRYEMKRFTLNTRHMPESHTALNIAASLEQLCAEWEIPTDCVKYVVTDNGSNIRAAARTLPWRQRACFDAHSATGNQ
ncbi:hypothetical protein HPB48_017719 [Haemaphysalis longicornis]|uniref:Uncharacterized protein n=1 Tax=Haemaphysalis longicornis TaxID=44386 RepID=A0A9J6FR47_HAELO|nr:hypothetical protein HPB48_017719 [Haemaphysalis longicornis]